MAGLLRCVWCATAGLYKPFAWNNELLMYVLSFRYIHVYGESLFVRNTVRITTSTNGTNGGEIRWGANLWRCVAMGMEFFLVGLLAVLRLSPVLDRVPVGGAVNQSPYGNFLIIAPVLVHRFRVPCRYSKLWQMWRSLQTMIEVSALCARACTCVCRTTNNNGHRRRI